MKKILALALMIAPGLAFAASSVLESATGRVHVQQVECFRAPCPAIVEIRDGDLATHISGDMAKDLAAFDGSIVTVKGSREAGAFTPVAFAPGSTADFITGTVKDVTHCPANARCEPKVAIVMGGAEYVVANAKLSHELVQITGATVTVRGAVGPDSTFVPKADRNVLVRGNLQALANGMNGQTHELRFPNGNMMMVAGKPAWDDRNHADVWISGKFAKDTISNTQIFKATKASRAIDSTPMTLSLPGVAAAGDGTNAGRDAETNPAAAQAAQAGSQSGAGVTR